MSEFPRIISEKMEKHIEDCLGMPINSEKMEKHIEDCLGMPINEIIDYDFPDLTPNHDIDTTGTIYLRVLTAREIEEQRERTFGSKSPLKYCLNDLYKDYYYKNQHPELLGLEPVDRWKQICYDLSYKLLGFIHNSIN